MFRFLKKLFNEPEPKTTTRTPSVSSHGEQKEKSTQNSIATHNDQPKRESFRLPEDSPVRKVWLEYQHQRVSESKGIKNLEAVAAQYEGQYPLDMHFVYLTLQDYYYTKRENKTMLGKCIAVLKKDMDLYSEFKEAYLKEHDYFVNYPAFKQMAIILEKQEKYHEAIQVCDRAMDTGVECNTKTGFEGRKRRLEKKLGKMSS